MMPYLTFAYIRLIYSVKLLLILTYLFMVATRKPTTGQSGLVYWVLWIICCQLIVTAHGPLVYEVSINVDIITF